MKKILVLRTLLMVLSIFVLSCSKNDESDNPEEQSIKLTSSDYTPNGYFDGVLYYRITSNVANEVEISKCELGAKEVHIPNHLNINENKYVVNSIGDKAFMDCKSLATIIFGNTISTIGNQAFSNC